MTPSRTKAPPPDADLLSPDLPMHLQLYRQLRVEILDGVWIGRDDFPGERELAERFGVSVITSRSALDRLAREGLVERSRGRRTRAVIPPEPVEAQAPALFPPATGPGGFRYEVVRAGVDTAPAAACQAFGVPAGTPLWQAVRVAHAGDEPHSIFHNVQRPEVGEAHAERDLQTQPMVSILRRELRPVETVRRAVQATTASPDAARHLGLTLDSPILLIVLRAYGTDGQLLEWTRLSTRPDQPLPEEILDLTTGRWSTAHP